MKNIAVIVCNCGLGHMRRVLAVLEAWERLYPGSACHHVYADLKKLARFRGIEALRTAGVTFHECAADSLNYEKEWMSKYSSVLKQADYIWSDNLPFPLKYHKNVVLTGSFLWSDVYDDQYYTEEEVLLCKYRPVMIGSKYFATDRVRALTNFKGVGLYEIYPPVHQQRGILLGCGMIKGANAYFADYLEGLKRVIITEGRDLMFWIEPDHFEHFKGIKNVMPAAFDHVMFKETAAAVIRPGLGKVSDVLAHGGRVFAFSEGGNFEIDHNTNTLVRMGVGEAVADPVTGLQAAIRFIDDGQARAKHAVAAAHLEGNGVVNIVDILKDVIG
jgi:hypothetical protein